MEFKAGSKKHNRVATIERSIGTDLASAAEMIGDSAVYSYYCRGASIAISAAGRTCMDTGGTVEDAKRAMREFDLKLGRGVRPISTGDALSKIAGMGLSPEILQKLFAWLLLNPGPSNEAIERAIELFKAGMEVAGQEEQEEEEQEEDSAK